MAPVALAHGEDVDAGGERGERTGERGLHAHALARAAAGLQAGAGRVNHDRGRFVRTGGGGRAGHLKPTASGQLQHEALYREQRGRVLSLCRLLLADIHEAEEVCHEVFVKLFEQRAAPPVPERWLTRVAVNACRDRRRAGWWRRWRERGEELVEAEHAARGPTPEEAALGLEQRQGIWRVFRRLSARQQEVFALRLLEGWSTDEVAETLGLSSGSVKRHLFRATHQLRAALRGTSWADVSRNGR